jgi:ribosomal protein S27E
MIQKKCPHCSRAIRVADEHAGKKIKCPGCKEVLALPAASTAVQPAKAPQQAAAVRKAPPVPKRPPVDDEDDDIAEITEAVEDDEDEEEEERKPRKRRKRKRGDWADCPYCYAPGKAKRVSWTLWGGALGPWMFSHVRCRECGKCYNGKTGKSNDVAIAIYLGISVLLGLMLGLVGTLVVILRK